jgi:hypothetical protein
MEKEGQASTLKSGIGENEQSRGWAEQQLATAYRRRRKTLHPQNHIFIYASYLHGIVYISGVYTRAACPSALSWPVIRSS